MKIINNTLKYIIILLINIVYMQKIPPIQYNEWTVIQNNNIWIGYSDYNNFPWVKSKIILDFNINKIANILKDQSNYRNIFERVILSEVIDDVVYIVLDMPFPISHRDYSVKYKEFESDKEKIYQFYSVENEHFPIVKDCIRLLRAMGEWRLNYINDNKTEVVYMWNGELLGDFPDWALKKAWKKQGDEVLTWLKESLDN